MIRARGALAVAMSCCAFVASPANADVMEIGADGARWIAGGDAVAETGIVPPVEEAADWQLLAGAEPEPAAGADFPAELSVPEHIVARTADHSQIVPEAYRRKVAELAARFDLSPSLIEAMVWQESRWRADAVSPVGARGLAQLMPGTARELGVDPRDPFANLEGGARYLRAQLDRFDGDVEKALAAYNAGPGRVIRAGGIPRIRETQLYVASIMGRLSDPARPAN
ncbi:lytic transglycosylase domain-containing protein [Qipengyuania sp.]|uniref:lytic transglycosylase domain-containing protein n=1 Tax=Qipengyuania sp. TaxID=2004515 RepID=UPI003735DF70